MNHPRHLSAPLERTAGIRLLCVDDHEVLAAGLKAAFAADGMIEVVGWLPSAATLLESAAELKPDVVLLDIEMPGPDAFERADRLRRILPQVRIIFLSAHIREGYIAAAYNCGAHGYFAKGDDLRVIAEGIRTAAHLVAGKGAAHEFLMGPKVRERCLAPRGTHSDATPTTHLATLSERELEILRLIGKGVSRNGIAKELSRSAKTIDGHQEHIMNKLGIDSRAELMRFAIREGLAEA
jgi:two-component system response regulator NreC